MRELIILSFFLLFSSCKEAKTPEISKTNVEKHISKDLDEDVILALSDYYITNPTLLPHHEQNKIVDYALKEGLALEKTASGLFYQIMEKGKGHKLGLSEELSVHYRGMLLDGKEFDSSYSRNAPIKFRIGQMIAGWNEGLGYLSHGDRAVFLIPSHLAYGEKGFPGFVGPNEILHFEIHVE